MLSLDENQAISWSTLDFALASKVHGTYSSIVSRKGSDDSSYRSDLLHQDIILDVDDVRSYVALVHLERA